MNKCKGCPWYGKAYWGILPPCNNCYKNKDTKLIIDTSNMVNIPTIDKEYIKNIDPDNNEFVALIENVTKDYIQYTIGEWKIEQDNWDKGDNNE